MKGITDEPLLKLFQSIGDGDEAMERDLDAHLRPKAVSIAASMGVASRDVEDVAQEALSAVFQQLRRRTFEGASGPLTWFRAIVANKVADHFRAIGRLVPQVPLTDEMAAAARGPIDEGRRAEIHDVLGRLTPKQRIALIGTEVLGASAAEVARLLGTEVGTVWSLKSRGAARFRELYRALPKPLRPSHYSPQESDDEL